MKQKLSQSVTYWLGVVAIGLVVGVSLQFVRAWTEPAVAPPGGNVGAPINTSNLSQQKIAGLAINAGEDTNGDTFIDTWNAIGLLIPNGNVGIGTASPSTRLDVNGGLRVRTLTTCSNATTGKLYADASGNVLCGTDQSSAGGGLGGSGTDNFIPRWNGNGALENSVIYQTDAGNVGIGITNSDRPLRVVGTTADDQHTIYASNPLGVGVGLGYLGALKSGSVQAWDKSSNTPVNLVLQGSGGKVIIGGTSPSTATFNVIGNVQATGDICTNIGGGKCLSTTTNTIVVTHQDALTSGTGTDVNCYIKNANYPSCPGGHSTIGNFITSWSTTCGGASFTVNAYHSICRQN